MKLTPIVRIAAVTAAIVSAFACDDVYEANLDATNIGGSAPPIQVVDAPNAPLPSLSVAPPLCPPALEDAGLDPTDAGVDSGPPSCKIPAAVCEYGASPDRQCNRVYACSSTGEGAWRTFPSERCAAEQCPKNAAISELEGRPCGIDSGAEADELLCNMSDGVCACTTGRGGRDVHARRWTCTKPLAQCPIARPNIGQPCGSGLVCDYGSCRSKRGVAMTCLGGVWAATSIDCAP